MALFLGVIVVFHAAKKFRILQTIVCNKRLVACPKCQGVFPITQGSNDLRYQGKFIALEGMQTACGAKLIASQGGFRS
ncbi:PAAR domain-containing protein [Xenorhabdus bovienii]|uniref:PAAR domain-containing protein n=1 Tax=Xenorhabdus bovienii TaxID=40576 RepID=UPI002A71EA53|nr:PAAR domain-containing protein [Xenorhabdus bovienii]MDE9467049.1 PAAR domain-containing protein [Xenorhabdus bovienii]MDE9498760.1 PAAR domain-containing protein [Xenorhabdus bovienii]MDE9563917.1 PAAR domain-containing protein [Xenorhabdus bovienii]